MTLSIGLLLGILAVALVLFWRDRVAPDVVALGVLLAIILFRLLPSQDAFAGFGSDTVLMILGLLILTSALQRTGVVDLVGEAILRRIGDHPGWIPATLMISTCLLSAFMSNTAATAFFLPIAIGLARRSSLSPSQLLLPMAFSSILSSSVTLISTSTNLVVSGLMTQRGMAPMGLFELAPVGLPIAILGLAYMLTVAPRLLPRRAAADSTDDSFGLRAYLTEVVVLGGSPLAGKTLQESGLGRDLDLNVLRIVRGGRSLLAFPEARLEEGDLLIVEGERASILRIKDRAGIDIKADAQLADVVDGTSEVRLAEGVLLPISPLVGGTLAEIRFRERYDLQVLAIHRHGEALHRKLSEVRLQIGDVLLLQGATRNLSLAEQDLAFQLLGAVEHERANRRRAPLAIAIFLFSLAAATSGLLQLPVAVLLGGLLVFLTGCVSPEQAYRDVEWRALVLIAAMLALGKAMDSTGTAAYLADLIVGWTTGLGPRWILSGFFALTVVLTQPMSNQAAAAVVFPVATQTAEHLGFDPRAFAIVIALAASCSYMTPLEPSCLMVYGPGRYRFADFMKVGALLTLLIFAVVIWLVPVFWPLNAGT
jgi:di/tricarboxylate transporter